MSKKHGYTRDDVKVKPAIPGLITTLNKMVKIIEEHVDILLPDKDRETVQDARNAVTEWSKYQLRGKEEDSK